MPQIEITPEQRDALYLSIIGRLTGLDDVFFEFQKGNFEAAQRLSGEFSDDLRVLHDDLGWGDTPLENIQLRAPRDVWVRALTRIQKRARSASRRLDDRALELDEERKRIQDLENTCAAIAEELSRSG